MVSPGVGLTVLIAPVLLLLGQAAVVEKKHGAHPVGDGGAFAFSQTGSSTSTGTGSLDDASVADLTDYIQQGLFGAGAPPPPATAVAPALPPATNLVHLEAHTTATAAKAPTAPVAKKAATRSLARSVAHPVESTRAALWRAAQAAAEATKAPAAPVPHSRASTQKAPLATSAHGSGALRGSSAARGSVEGHSKSAEVHRHATVEHKKSSAASSQGFAATAAVAEPKSSEPSVRHLGSAHGQHKVKTAAAPKAKAPKSTRLAEDSTGPATAPSHHKQEAASAVKAAAPTARADSPPAEPMAAPSHHAEIVAAPKAAAPPEAVELPARAATPPAAPMAAPGHETAAAVAPKAGAAEALSADASPGNHSTVAANSSNTTGAGNHSAVTKEVEELPMASLFVSADDVNSTGNHTGSENSSAKTIATNATKVATNATGANFTAARAAWAEREGYLEGQIAQLKAKLAKTQPEAQPQQQQQAQQQPQQVQQPPQHETEQLRTTAPQPQQPTAALEPTPASAGQPAADESRQETAATHVLLHRAAGPGLRPEVSEMRKRESSDSARTEQVEHSDASLPRRAVQSAVAIDSDVKSAAEKGSIFQGTDSQDDESFGSWEPKAVPTTVAPLQATTQPPAAKALSMPVTTPAPSSMWGWLRSCFSWLPGGAAPAAPQEKKEDATQKVALLASKAGWSKQDLERVAEATRKEGSQAVEIRDAWGQLEADDARKEAVLEAEEQTARMVAETPDAPHKERNSDTRGRHGAEVGSFWNKLEHEDADIERALQSGDSLEDYERLTENQDEQVTRAAKQMDKEELQAMRSAAPRHGDNDFEAKALEDTFANLESEDAENAAQIRSNPELQMLQLAHRRHQEAQGRM